MINVGKSERLSFKFMDESDGELFFELDQDPAVMRFINAAKPSCRAQINDVFIPRLNRYRNAKNGWGLWQVNISKNNLFIGWILVRPMDFFSDQPQWQDLELGWRFKQLAWGKGYATEAARHIQKTLTEQGNTTHFSAIAVTENIGSIKIMKKLGMKHIKTVLDKNPQGDMSVEYYQMPAKK